MEEIYMMIKMNGKENITMEKEDIILILDQEKVYDRVRWD
jgi:hypothetical protein